MNDTEDDTPLDEDSEDVFDEEAHSVEPVDVAADLHLHESKEDILKRKKIRQLLERRLERKRLREELDDFIDLDAEESHEDDFLNDDEELFK